MHYLYIYVHTCRGVLQPFRYTLYVGTKSPNHPEVPLGLDETYHGVTLADFDSDDIVIIDATGGHLPATFKHGKKLGLDKQSIKYMAVHPLFSPSDTRSNMIELSYICRPDVLPALSLFGKRPTLKQVGWSLCLSIYLLIYVHAYTYMHTYTHKYIFKVNSLFLLFRIVLLDRLPAVQLIEVNQNTFIGKNYVADLNKISLMKLLSFLIKTDQIKILRNVPNKVREINEYTASLI